MCMHSCSFILLYICMFVQVRTIILRAISRTALIRRTFSMTATAVNMLYIAVIAVIGILPDWGPVAPDPIDLRIQHEVLLLPADCCPVVTALRHKGDLKDRAGSMKQLTIE